MRNEQSKERSEHKGLETTVTVLQRDKEPRWLEIVVLLEGGRTTEHN